MSATATAFTPLTALAGGGLIGGAVAVLWVFNGQIAGVSGILSRSLAAKPNAESAAAFAFILGILAAPFGYIAVTGNALPLSIAASPPALILAGLLVGTGTVLANGCTSGHGVCGIARLSKRSLAATATFMATAIVTVWVGRHGIGG